MHIDMDAVKAIVKQAGAMFGNREAADHIKTKGVADYVTEVDLSVQNFVQEELYRLYPDMQFLGEEKNNDDIVWNGFVWVLDPVDGTTNLIKDYKASAVSLALFENGKPVMGMIYDPYLDELYSAYEGQGAYMNGKRIRVSEADTLAASLVAVGTTPYHKEYAEENFDLFKRVFIECLDIRRGGSAALDLAHTACGRVDGFLERKLKIWDFGAGMLLVREAGGKVTDYQGNDLDNRYIGDVIAGNAGIVSLLQKMV